MNYENFDKFIEPIGFKYHWDNYRYEKFLIHIWKSHYTFYDGSKWSEHNYNDLTPLEYHFKKYFRSIKLKQILG